ncbi:ABC transporter permease subunit [Sporolactobacillus shoreicorticis]|uniref:ABC transporter permease n=1 Tax=Sporolactobacillus shoreicorticis TaxID=1923877 RepID=A0ABW5S1S3_9BACL|nr:ABC transporter permease subunit [Sporolactobacillus shoreicorticis]MCO7125371.1 ABC transporter permease subunit [Sporolactobacillus shoreicorticis]
MRNVNRLIISLFVAFMCLPILITLVYSFATEWGKSIFPSGYTFKWYLQLYKDPQFIAAILRSLLLTVVTLGAVLVILVPSIALVAIYLPKYDRFFKPTVLLPYAIPGVVLATGLMRTYTNGFVPLFAVLSGGLFIYSLPFMYQSVRSSLQEIDGARLMEAAEVLGASKVYAFIRILLPNIKIGIMVGSLLTFSAFFGEFQLTNMILGGDFETIRIYMLRVMKVNGHLSSSVVMTYLILLIMVSALIVKVTNINRKRIIVPHDEAALNSNVKRSPANELLNH